MFVYNLPDSSLRSSLHSYDNYDSIKLAKKLEKHELLEFRRIAALLYRFNSKWDESLSLSKADRLWGDALETAAASKSTEVAEDLGAYYLSIGAKEAFVALIFVAYELVRPDWVEEMSWRYGLGDFVKPYELQQRRDHGTKVSALEKELKELKAKQKKDEPEDESSMLAGGLGGRLLIGGPGPQAGFGMNGGGMMQQPTGMMGMQPTGW